MWISNMGVDLCSADVAVAKHCLNRSEISTIHEQVCREAVTECVWTDVLGNARQQSIASDKSLNTTNSQTVEISAGR